MDKKATLKSVIPALKFESTDTNINDFKSLRGQRIVLYFYPKDNTPGCTRESNDFKEAHQQLKKLNTIVLGVSRDSIKSHNNFIEKFDLPFALISDPDETVCKAFDVIQMKKLYGREYMGIERSTFLIDEKGKLQQEWRKVKVKDHVTEVIAAIESLD